MPKISDNAARVTYKFKGKTVGVPTHYAVGHTMAEPDVKFANRQLASVLGNVLASALNRLAEKRTEDNAKLPEGDPKKGTVVKVEDITDAEAQTMFDAIYNNYEIGVNNNRGDGTGVAHDPVEAIARNIAWERLKVILKERNIKVSSVNAEKKAELVGQLLDRDPTIREAAKTQLGGAKPALDDSLFAGLGTSAPVADAGTSPTTVATDTATATTGTDTTSGTTAPAPITGEAPIGDTTANPGTVSNADEGTGQGTPDASEPVIGAVNAGTPADAPSTPEPTSTDPNADPGTGITSPNGGEPGGAFA